MGEGCDSSSIAPGMSFGKFGSLGCLGCSGAKGVERVRDEIPIDTTYSLSFVSFLDSSVLGLVGLDVPDG